VWTLTVNRPEVRNALDKPTAQALHRALQSAEAAPETRVIVITGAVMAGGAAFGAGADIRAAMSDGITPGEAHKILTEAYAPLIQGIWACKWPVIAAVDGVAAGISCDLALACDLRLLSTRGALAELFARIGLIPDGGGTYLLPRLLGLGRALEVMFFGERIEAEQALALGLANKVLPVETFLAEVHTYAHQLAAQSPQALMYGKRAMKAALEDKTLGEAMAREADLQRAILESEDGFEGFAAFLQKRPPVWKWQG
jgi:2-(1,2-epoxy-1,2-dihydrophenyl)acetyl-CoA isomerase